MNFKKGIIFVFLIATCDLRLATCAMRTIMVKDAFGRPVARAVESQVLVKFKAATPEEKKKFAHEGIRAEKQGDISSSGWVSIQLPPGLSIEQALEYYRKNPNVLSVEPNRVYHPLKNINDPLLNQQYGLSNINAFGAWEFETGVSSPVKVAVIDTGVDGTHPDLDVGSKLDGDFTVFDPGTGANLGESSPSTDACGHGTAVAGVAAAAGDNAKGVAGLSWGSGTKILSLRIFDSGCDSASDAALANAIYYAVQRSTATGTRMVINMSLGECNPAVGPCVCGQAIIDAVNTALANNVVVVAAAGNLDATFNPNKQVTCPAKIPGVIAVGATNSFGSVASFSAVGPDVTVVAPGVSVATTKKGGSYEFNASGTSFASPYVAGLAALILSALPSATTTQVIDFIKNTADDFGLNGKDDSYGYGQINAYRALRLAKNGTLSGFEGETTPIAFPNPFRVSTHQRVSFAIPQSLVGSNLDIRIYNMSGELIRTLQGLTWDGTNDDGQSVASGVYIYFIKSDRGKGKGRLALIR
ncbi:MAG: S8 family serine peptidase [Elusimicrobia bacterium]|nr:S8 family serine peptidase [Elusimicrobiota bacterium]